VASPIEEEVEPMPGSIKQCPPLRHRLPFSIGKEIRRDCVTIYNAYIKRPKDQGEIVSSCSTVVTQNPQSNEDQVDTQKEALYGGDYPYGRGSIIKYRP